MPLSFHIDCTYKWEQIKTFLASPHVKTAFLMNASVEQVQYALQHCEFVVVRFYDIFNERNSLGEDFEKSIVNRRPGSDFVNWLDNSPFKVFKGNKKVRFVLSWNELYSKRGQAEREQNTRIVAIGQALVNAGYGVGLGAWAADKSFYADDVSAGHWDNVIRFAVDHKDMVSIDCHEYDVLTIFAGHLKQYPDGFPNTLKTAIALDPNNHAKIPYSRDEGNIETNYKIGRIALLLQRSIDITGQHFNWYRGECALDFKDDGALKQLIDSWYKPQFGHPTGINSLQDYYRHVLGNITNNAYDELIFRQHTDLVEQDPPSNQGNFIFAWNGDVLRWLPFDVSQRPYFVQLVQNYQEDTQPMPDPIVFDPPLYDAKVSVSNGYLNLRANMSASSTDLGDITTTPIEMKVSKQTNEANGLQWYKFKQTLPTGDIVGYFANVDKLRIEYPNDVPDETPDDTMAELFKAIEDKYPILKDLQEYQQLMEQVSIVKTTVSKLEQDVADMKSQFELIHVDIPIPNFTLSLPRFMVPYVVTKHRGNAGLEEAIAQRTESGTPTLSQIANEIYSTATVEPSLDTHTNVSDLGSDMILDEMMNPSAEDDNEKLAS